MTPRSLGLFVKKLQPKVGLGRYDILFAYFVVEAKSKNKCTSEKLFLEIQKFTHFKRTKTFSRMDRMISMDWINRIVLSQCNNSHNIITNVIKIYGINYFKTIQ